MFLTFYLFFLYSYIAILHVSTLLQSFHTSWSQPTRAVDLARQLSWPANPLPWQCFKYITTDIIPSFASGKGLKSMPHFSLWPTCSMHNLLKKVQNNFSSHNPEALDFNREISISDKYRFRKQRGVNLGEPKNDGLTYSWCQILCLQDLGLFSRDG